ncbi:MAG: GntR family transcriptional regulator [Planctomycetota bacterium]|nr:GntR family transcriptional regulator [Planctomycetota bacterium]
MARTPLQPRKLKHTLVSRALLDDLRSLHPGHKLPTVRQLMKRFGASQATIARALDELKRQGLISRKAGSGVYVERPRPVHGDYSVAVVVPDVSTTTSSLMLKGIEREFSASGYRCVFWNGNRHFRRECARIRAGGASIDGLIVNSRTHYVYNPAYIAFHARLLKRHAWPMVMVDIPVPGLPAPFVGDDNYSAFHDLGALIASANLADRLNMLVLEGSLIGMERLYGLRRGLRAAGGPVPRLQVVHANPRTLERRVKRFRLLNRRPGAGPRLLVNADPRFLPHLRSMLRQEKLKLPEELLLFSVCESRDLINDHDLPFVALVKPSEDVGAAAARAMKKLLAGQPCEPALRLPLTRIVPPEYRALLGMKT